jgi:prepilin-type N-terminal cleavage/methylation domain-containing protein
MLQAIWKRKKRSERGFTLIELVVVLAILGILIALAVPRYLGARKSALVAEGDNALQEMKTLSWAYYQQYSTFAGLDTGFPGVIGFQAPGTACWSFTIPSATAALVTLRATGNSTGRTACAILTGSEQINVTLDNTGASTRATTGL